MHTCFHPDLQPGVLELTEEEALHVVRVLRMKEGESVRLMDGMGGVATGELVRWASAEPSVHVEEVSRSGGAPFGIEPSWWPPPSTPTALNGWSRKPQSWGSRRLSLCGRAAASVGQTSTPAGPKWSWLRPSNAKGHGCPAARSLPAGRSVRTASTFEGNSRCRGALRRRLDQCPSQGGMARLAVQPCGRLACRGAGRGFLGRRSGMVARSRSDACPPRRPALEDRNGGHGRRGSIHHESVTTE